MTYTEWGVVLGSGVVCPAASLTVARHYGPEPGFPVMRRTVKSTALKRSGSAVVEVGPWSLKGE